MSRRARLAQSILRSTALLLALVCLWLSSGATLRHTDDLSAFRSFHAGRSVDRHTAKMPAAADFCAAHRWMDAWQTLAGHRPALKWAAVTPAVFVCTLTPALHLRGFDYVSLRGPPPALS